MTTMMNIKKRRQKKTQLPRLLIDDVVVVVVSLRRYTRCLAMLRYSSWPFAASRILRIVCSSQAMAALDASSRMPSLGRAFVYARVRWQWAVCSAILLSLRFDRPIFWRLKREKLDIFLYSLYFLISKVLILYHFEM